MRLTFHYRKITKSPEKSSGVFVLKIIAEIIQLHKNRLEKGGKI